MYGEANAPFFKQKLLPVFHVFVEVVHLFVREAEGDLRVEVDDDRLNSVRRHVELRTRNSGPPKIGRSLILKKD
jgi:hypothetical protein